MFGGEMPGEGCCSRAVAGRAPPGGQAQQRGPMGKSSTGGPSAAVWRIGSGTLAVPVGRGQGRRKQKSPNTHNLVDSAV
jgi:hypothetical protein